MDIDSPNFDPKTYVLSMLKQNTIKELIRKNNQIDQQIKAQDHEIQSLVFENYSKFISSIDTVRQMKDNICMVDEKLKVLDKSMDNISNLALKIDETFKFKRKEIQKLDTVNKDLQKLRNLCDFPNVLKQDLAEYKTTHENKISQSFVEGPKLFSKSIAVYEECYKTLEELKSEPLIEPIYKESLNKIQEMRSVLRTRQVQYSKQHMNSAALRTITKNLIIISDQQNQVSVLRSYFYSWKDRLIVKKKMNKIENNQKYDKSIGLPELLTSTKMPEMNEEFWTQYIKEYSFIYDELYDRLASTDEIRLLVSNHTKQLFNWSITGQLQEIPLYSSSIKSYVLVNHIVSGNLRQTIQIIKGKSKVMDPSRIKIHTELSNILEEKIVAIGQNMLNFVFGRLKIAIMEQVCQSKKSICTLTVSEDLLKQSYIKVLGPIKQNFKTNFEPVLDDLEHLNSSYEHIFKTKEEYDEAIHSQIHSLIHFIALIISIRPESVSEDLFTLINKTSKLHKLEKNYIQASVKAFRQVEENGPWFVVANNYLNYVNNNLGKKIIESAHKRIEAGQNYNYASVFTFLKDRMGLNLLNLICYYSGKINVNPQIEPIFQNIHQFVEIINSVFPDSRRSILKKPSFLTERGSYFHETEIMSAKKLRIIEKSIIQERNFLLTAFIRRVLKNILICLRTKKGSIELSGTNIYCLIQICYEMGNVEEETQISAFYYLLPQNCDLKAETSASEECQNSYSELRRKYFESSV